MAGEALERVAFRFTEAAVREPTPGGLMLDLAAFAHYVADAIERDEPAELAAIAEVAERLVGSSPHGARCSCQCGANAGHRDSKYSMHFAASGSSLTDGLLSV